MYKLKSKNLTTACMAEYHRTQLDSCCPYWRFTGALSGVQRSLDLGGVPYVVLCSVACNLAFVLLRQKLVVGASLVLVEPLMKPFQLVSVVFHSPCLNINTQNNDDIMTIKLVSPTLVCSAQIPASGVKSSWRTTGPPPSPPHTAHIFFLPSLFPPLPECNVFDCWLMCSENRSAGLIHLPARILMLASERISPRSFSTSEHVRPTAHKVGWCYNTLMASFVITKSQSWDRKPWGNSAFVAVMKTKTMPSTLTVLMSLSLGCGVPYH